jgi:hypothetical protein
VTAPGQRDFSHESNALYLNAYGTAIAAARRLQSSSGGTIHLFDIDSGLWIDLSP